MSWRRKLTLGATVLACALLVAAALAPPAHAEVDNPTQGPAIDPHGARSTLAAGATAQTGDQLWQGPLINPNGRF